MTYEHLAVSVVVAAVFAFVAKLLKQPLIIGYLLAGVVLGVLGFSGGEGGLQGLGTIGVALLLFLVGLEMNISELPSIGKVALLTGIGQIVFTSSVGFLLSSVLGFGFREAIYIAIALTFSSTIIIVKLLSEKNDLNSLYGKISVGFLLVQDFVAVLILMFLGSLGRGEFNPLMLGLTLIKLAVLCAVLFIISKKILPGLFKRYLDSSTELVFMFSIAWALGVSAFVGGPLGISIEIGGFLAGLSLSSLPEHLQVASRTRPLRDFFLTLFFIVLGANLVIGNIGVILIPALIYSLFVLVGNPIIVMIIMGIMGYKKRTSFSASMTVAQISEFSLILMAMGASLGHVGGQTVALIVLVGVITMTASTYMILNTEYIFSKISRLLQIFERKNTHEIKLHAARELEGHIVLVGCDRTGSIILNFLSKKAHDYVVVDHNPRVARSLSAKNIPVVFGDIEDEDVAEEAKLGKAKLVISTTSNFHDNLVLTDRLKLSEAKPVIILKATSKRDAMELYDRGASYVVVPEVLAGEFIRQILGKFKGNYSGKKMFNIRKKHFDRLVANTIV